MRHLSAVLFFVCCSALAAVADIEVTHDRASGETTIKTKVRGATATPYISLYAIFPASTKEPPNMALILSASFESWRYQACHRTSWLVDNNPFELPQPSHEGKRGEGFVAEFLTIRPLLLEQIRHMAKAKKIEFTICNDAYTVSPEEMKDFRTFVDKVRENVRK
jgi:hypothetical protein